MTTTPGFLSGTLGSAQDLYTITYPVIDTKQTSIANVSKATTASVSLGSATTVISTTGTVGTIAGSGPYTAVISGMTTTAGLLTGQNITATAGTGNLGVGTTYVSSIIGNDSIGITSSATTNAGTITNVSIVTPTKIPAGMVDGTPVIIEDVGGMTELATAGIDGSNKFYANVTGPTSFTLYTDAALTANVNSSGFTNATASTGYFQQFTVPQYNTVADGQTVVFDTAGESAGTDIALATTTGVLTLATDLSFSLTATVDTTMPLSPNTEAGYQWYNVTAEESFGPFVKFGEACTTTITTTEESEVVLKVYANETEFSYPNQLTSASFTAEVIGGYTVV